MLVVDASVAVGESLDPIGFSILARRDAVAPALLWSEVTSAMREMAWRGEISAALARAAIGRLGDAPIRRRHARDLHARSFAVAERLGWAKTYDAEYVALAEMLGCPLLTVDARLKRVAGALVKVIGPTELT